MIVKLLMSQYGHFKKKLLEDIFLSRGTATWFQNFDNISNRENLNTIFKTPNARQ